MKEITIGDRKIGGDKTFIIAEVGSNHCQDINLAFETIDAAVAAGADAVKFQSLNVDQLYLNPSQEIIDLHKKIDFPEEWHLILKQYCEEKGILFFSSPTYLSVVDLMEEISVSLYKLASAQVGTFPQIIEKVAKTGKPVILSTGLVDYGQVQKVVQIFKNAGNEKYIILHCNSLYPAPYNKVNLRLMNVYSEMFDCISGFSDHTLGNHICVAAVALGAKVIEKHITLRRDLPSPDAPLAIEPHEFSDLVKSIREVEESLQFSPRLSLEKDEFKFKNRILYKPILKVSKLKGSFVDVEDFEFKRTALGEMDANKLFAETLPQRLTRDFAKGDFFQ
ncbi:N-acetylneuraminate synthase family protein [Leptospira sp. 201903071]|uniref:N-acetylneuraminate synthase family protein n=1 Tax=Leptospira ainazelensis TaxID=2810034 RepID=UPI0019653A73|nr:N-acetylneuraminate synthase family protein [Leptospira ainazelensis]MBM9501958.1 N-acetylneuraminate synthase family protein [Leptospira ainazelensis]